MSINTALEDTRNELMTVQRVKYDPANKLNPEPRWYAIAYQDMGHGAKRRPTRVTLYKEDIAMLEELGYDVGSFCQEFGERDTPAIPVTVWLHNGLRRIETIFTKEDGKLTPHDAPTKIRGLEHRRAVKSYNWTEEKPKMEAPQFNPLSKRTMLGKKAYLMVTYRLIWFHIEKPEWVIETDLHELAGVFYVKAIIRDDAGRIRATGLATMRQASKQEKAWEGREIEKCETAAIGRALERCGYGTGNAILRFANAPKDETPDFASDDDEGDHLSSAPVEFDIDTGEVLNGQTTETPAKPKGSSRKPITTTQGDTDLPAWLFPDLWGKLMGEAKLRAKDAYGKDTIALGDAIKGLVKSELITEKMSQDEIVTMLLEARQDMKKAAGE